ncbi:hypothetical protein IQ240_09880 [Nodularia sp. LEGE 04288]|nr:hypothetical protein [Nodularia sp. LEGE 04288]
MPKPRKLSHKIGMTVLLIMSIINLSRTLLDSPRLENQKFKLLLPAKA